MMIQTVHAVQAVAKVKMIMVAKTKTVVNLVNIMVVASITTTITLRQASITMNEGTMTEVMILNPANTIVEERAVKVMKTPEIENLTAVARTNTEKTNLESKKRTNTIRNPKKMIPVERKMDRNHEEKIKGAGPVKSIINT